MSENPLTKETINKIREKIMISEVPGHSMLLEYFKEDISEGNANVVSKEQILRQLQEQGIL